MSDPLEPLRVKFRARTIGDAARLREAVASGETGRAEIERIVHAMAGAAGMFGFADLGEAASGLDRRFADRDPPPDADVLAFAARIERDIADA